MKKLLISLALGAIVVPVIVFSQAAVPEKISPEPQVSSNISSGPRLPASVSSKFPAMPAFPHKINYQGMVTDNDGLPVTGYRDFVFKIYNHPVVGSMLWSETQNGLYLNNGLFNATLGIVNPIDLSFYEADEFWLDITVDGEHVPQRLHLISVAFAYRALKADSAEADPDWTISGNNMYSAVSGNVGIGTFGPSQKLDVEGTVQMRGFRMPTGASFGHVLTSDASGRGTWAPAPSPSHDHDAEYVNVNGPDSIRGSSSTNMFWVRNYGTGDGIYIYAPHPALGDGMIIDSAGDRGIEIVNTGDDGIYMDDVHEDAIWMTDIDHMGIYMDDIGRLLTDAGIYMDDIFGNGIYLNDIGRWGIVINETAADGIFIRKPSNSGIWVDSAKFDGIRVWHAEGEGISAYGDFGNSVESGANYRYGLYVYSYSWDNSNPGLYVDGTAHCTGGGWSKSLPGPSGEVPAFSVSSREVELIASGTGTLVSGRAQVSFEPEFQEAVSAEVPMRVVVTAQDAPSALLYVTNKSNQGFTVKPLDIPELSLKSDNVSFDWIAIGRQKGYERRPQILIPSEEDLLAEKLEEQRKREENALYHQQMMEMHAQREAEREKQSTD